MQDFTTNITRQPPNSAKRRAALWRFSSAEVTLILGVAASVLWLTIVIVVPSGQPVLGGDFMVFYTFGTAARFGQWGLQYDWPAFHALQTSLVPGSDPYVYPPAYPPLVPALYAPLAFLPFTGAYAFWVACSTALYSWLIFLAARKTSFLSTTQALLVSLLFPPFVAHQVWGQSSIWPLVGFVLGWYALTQGQPFKAGLLLSLIAIKPQFGMALAVVTLALRLGPIIAGLVVGLICQAVVTTAICGTAPVLAYVDTTLAVLRDTGLLEPKDPRFTHAIKTSLESLMAPNFAMLAWLAVNALFGWQLIKVWRAGRDWTLKMAALLLATLLISPHVQTYDAILLAPATLWLTHWAISTSQPAVVAGVLALPIAFVLPYAQFGGIPLTIPLMAWLLWRLVPSGFEKNAYFAS